MEYLVIPIQKSDTKTYIFEGDTIHQIVISGDEFPVLTTSTIKMQLYRNNKLYFDVSNGNGITVDSATQFTINKVEAVDNPFNEGEYEGDLEITDVDGVKTTYFRVRYIIQKEYTK